MEQGRQRAVLQLTFAYFQSRVFARPIRHYFALSIIAASLAIVSDWNFFALSFRTFAGVNCIHCFLAFGTFWQIITFLMFADPLSDACLIRAFFIRPIN